MNRPSRAMGWALALSWIAAPPAGALTTEDVLQLARAGASDDAIVARIHEEKPSFHLTVEDLLRFSREGVGEKVLKAMMSAGAAAPIAAAAPAARPTPEAVPPARVDRDPAPVWSPDFGRSRVGEPQLDRLAQVTTDIQQPLSSQVQRMLGLNSPHCVPGASWRTLDVDRINPRR